VKTACKSYQSFILVEALKSFLPHSYILVLEMYTSDDGGFRQVAILDVLTITKTLLPKGREFHLLFSSLLKVENCSPGFNILVETKLKGFGAHY